MAKFGFLNSLKTREKMSLAKLGKVGEDANGYGKKHPHSEKTKTKISLSVRGENNPNWKGGLSKLGKQIRASTVFYDENKPVYLDRELHTLIRTRFHDKKEKSDKDGVPNGSLKLEDIK